MKMKKIIIYSLGGDDHNDLDEDNDDLLEMKENYLKVRKWLFLTCRFF